VLYLVLFLIVVAVGGLGSLKGTLLAALVLGIFDTAGKYLLADAGGFFIYAVTVVVLLIKPAGSMAASDTDKKRGARLGHSAERKRIRDARRIPREPHRLHWPEALPWLIALAAYFCSRSA